MKVALVTRIVTHYRVPFYEQLKKDLERLGIELEILYGLDDPRKSERQQAVDLSWGRRIRSRYFNLFGKRLVWLSAGRLLGEADLVVLDQQARQLFSTFYLLRRSRPPVAFWTHGQSHHMDSTRLGRWLKVHQLRRADWVFGYTDSVFQYASAAGFPQERVTSVENAVDTVDLRRGAVSLESRRVEQASLFGFEPTSVGLFLGSMYPDKRLEFLVEAVDQIRHEIPGFGFIAIGSGESSGVIIGAAQDRPWLRYEGHVRGEELGRLASLADVLLLPGLIGLPILDGFALGIPTITIDSGGHSPEIEYLESGVNSLVLRNDTDPRTYAASVSELCQNEAALEAMRRECRVSGERYTIENMAARFSCGVAGALSAGRRSDRRRN
jgi:glycosyltransferase involved in cell wall biosynthesis